MKFPRFNNRARVYIDAAQEILGSAAIMYASKACEYSGFEGPTLASAVETLAIHSLPASIQVLVRVGGVTHVAIVRDHMLPVFEKIYEHYHRSDFYLTWNGKPVDVTSNPLVLGMQEASTIVCNWRLCGGSRAVRIKVHDNYFKCPTSPDRRLIGEGTVRSEELQRIGASITLPWTVPFSHRAREFAYTQDYLDRGRCEDVLSRVRKGEIPNSSLSERLSKRERSRMRTELQSDTIDPHAFLREHVSEDVLNFIEDVTLLCLQMMRARDNVDRALAVTVFLKLRTRAPLISSVAAIISDVAADFNQPQLQNEELLQQVTDLRSMIAQWENIQQSSLVQQITRVYKYAVALGVFALVGVKVDEKVAYMCKKELASPMAGVNFMTTVLDTIALFIQRALMYKKTGTWETFIYGPKSFGKWFDMCQKVKREFQFRGDLESQGTSYHQFVGDLKQCVDDGKAILRYGSQASGMEIMGVKKLLNEILLMQAEISTFREAQKSRRPPFGLLVYGKTCVGKSTFTSMLYQFAGKFWDLPTDDEYRYTRNTCDDFWSGWDSMKWFLLLDDIAFGDPNSKVVDNSLTEVIQIMNDVPLVPNQASLEDKGRNPLRAKMVVATTNTRHLNAHAYFACPIAVQRRFPFVLVVKPKPEFARDDDPEMIDPAKLPPIQSEWPNFWVVQVERVVATSDNQAQYETVQVFSDINRFFQWLGNTMQLFTSIQAKAGAGVAAMRDFKLCRGCCMLEKACVCTLAKEYLQAREYCVPQGKRLGQSFEQRIEADDAIWTYTFTPSGTDPGEYIKKTVVTKNGRKLREFSGPVKVHADRDQVEVQSSDADMADVLAEILRIQGKKSTAVTMRAVHWCADVYLRAYANSRLVRRFTNYAMEWSVVRKVVLRGFRWYTSEREDYFTWLANALQASYVPRKWQIVLGGLAAVTALISTYGLYKAVAARKPHVQGLRQSVDDARFPQTEKLNVWKRDDYQTSSIDRSELSASLAHVDYDTLMKIVERNTARIKVTNGIMAREGNVFSPCGHLWMTNNHTLFAEGDLEVSLSVVPHIQGAASNVVFKLRQVDIFRMPERDVAFFEVHSWETKRDLRQLIRSPTLRGAYTATYVTRTKGINTKLTVIKCAVQERREVPMLDATIDMWTGWAQEPTVVGDCGSPLVSHKPVATVLGIHTLGNAHGAVWATEIDTQMVDAAIKHFDMPVVQCASPVIGAPSRPKRLGPLRQRSPLRWLEEGSINVYGSYIGQSVTSRSKVRPTLLGSAILEERGWTVDFQAPQLRDWRPWRHALVDSTQKKFGSLSGSVMKDIARAFTDDILERIPREELAMLEPLSDKATVNGIAGVRFIDKMNFKSSMGEPYNKTKKGFLSGTEGELEFNEEVMARISHIRAQYSSNCRACPVFSGKLKDEPRATKKVAEGKVRVFTAAPADWSFVVRQFLLPVVKLMQENPFVFEASPGCTVQSLEWQQYYDYLTHFGPERMVAGDYGKFDKKMEALIILLAFRVLRNLLSAAGWAADEIGVVDCIAEDTAYAFVNFDGDLVEFFGSNPSGHPLTVIINCIVNALYMRYAFVTLHPGEGDVYAKAREFKSRVRLLTYGDDNAMGVSPEASWFNHTAIQRAMSDIGVEYTMADKESHSRPFIHIREVSYLKRVWRWDEDVGAVVAPLEEASIHKMLTICNPSGEESPELHMASVMVSAANEWFWHGKDKFDKERAWLLSLAKKHNLLVELEFKKFPTWIELRERFWTASKTIEVTNYGCEEEHPRNILPN